jgi:outer membrane protein TolC
MVRTLAEHQLVPAGLLPAENNGKQQEMKLFQNTILLFIAVLFSTAVAAQDSVRTLSVQQFMQLVRQYHPVALQAENAIEQARAGVTSARGFFDPVLEFYSAEKVFDGKQYYNYAQPQVTLPTWYGIEVYAGAEYLAGGRTSPEETLGRTSYAGISVPLLKNLLMDRRRAALQQAKILEQQSRAEKRAVLNDLLRDALNSYWAWVQQQLIKNTIDQIVIVNEKRLELIKTSYRLGERPAIDTVEALAQLQTYLSLQQEQNLELQNTGLDLSFFLWKEGSTPYLLPQDVQPATPLPRTVQVALPAMDSLLNTALTQHPELQLYGYKLNSLAVEQRLKFQSLLPKLDLKYNQLGKGYDVVKTATAPILHNNYQYGVSFVLPLRLSEGRGEYRRARLKIQSTELELAQKTLVIENKVRAYINKQQALQAQFNIQQSALQNFITLQRAEETRFFSGESSLFLINSRENKVLEARQKLIELQTKLAQTNIDVQWAAGTLHREVRL